MKKSLSAEKQASLFWAEILPGIQKTLEETLASLAGREHALAGLSAVASGDVGKQMADIREGIGGLAACAERSGQTAAATETLLQEGEGELRSFIAATEVLRQRLADWAAGAIG